VIKFIIYFVLVNTGLFFRWLHWSTEDACNKVSCQHLYTLCGKERRRERMMSICFTWFPIRGLGEPNI